MWAFIRSFFATLLALITFFILFIVFLGAIMAGFQTKDVAPLSNDSVLKLTLDKPILEREIDNPLSELGFPWSSEASYGLVEIKKTLKQAKKDDKIKGIYLNLTSLQAGSVSI